MMISEFNRLANGGVLILICVVFAMIIIASATIYIGTSFKKFATYIFAVATIMALLAVGIFGLFFERTEVHQYYSYTSQEEIKVLVGQGWEVVTNYENRKILHIKKEQ